MSLMEDLLDAGWVPVVASVGISREGTLLNVNADTLAAHLASALRAHRLILAGGTAGVLDAGGSTIPSLTPADIGAMTQSGAAHSGMVAKLTACRRALDAGVAAIAIVQGRGAADFESAAGTRIVRAGDYVEMQSR
jgi:acetylglutamate kinase